MELMEALLRAFVVGGLICAVGQLLIDYTALTPARILVSFVVLGVVLGGLGIYQPLLDFAGAGASVPLTGFGTPAGQGGAGGHCRPGCHRDPHRRADRCRWRHHHRHCRCPADCPAVPLPGQGIGSSLPGTEILFPVYIPDLQNILGISLDKSIRVCYYSIAIVIDAEWSSWQLVGLITRRSLVQVQPPQPNEKAPERVLFSFDCN